jgi:hypothetical protein
MSKFWSLASLVIGAAIILDLVTHPTGTSAAFTGATGLSTGVLNSVTGASNVKAGQGG